jgi:hypothetical protein
MRCALTLLLVTLIGCGTQRAPLPTPTTQRAGQATVVWVSVDGLRSDYLARFSPPALSRLAREGAYTHELSPVFPSLTFPNHTSQVTGTFVDVHGIVGNVFYDSSTGQRYNFPKDGSLMRAEPIWVTAKRQSLRVAVVDWPMGQGQTGPFVSDYFAPEFDSRRSDAQRMLDTMSILTSDPAPATLRLVLSYIGQIDSTGHRFGPDSPQIEQAVRDTDAIIDGFVKSLVEWFEKTHGPDDELYLLLTTDHGMQPLHTQVNLELCIGADLMDGATIVEGGAVSMIHLINVPAERKQTRSGQIVQKLSAVEYIRAWPASQVPKELHFADPTRAGDILVTFAPGYVRTTQRIATTMPISSGSVATHGYDVASCPNMLGTAIVWRYRRRIGGVDLGPIDNTQWHSTVAGLLRIEPASGSNPRSIPLLSVKGKP